MGAKEQLSASMEDYLEAIFQIIADQEAVRPKDIAERLSVSNASVTGALRSLSEKGLINYAPYDVITLTPRGKKAAKDVVRRHSVLRDFFVNVLAIDFDAADDAACRMEHNIPAVVLERFIEFARFIEVCPRGGGQLLSGFRYHCTHDGKMDDCETCISTILEHVKTGEKGEGALKPRPLTLLDVNPGERCKILAIKKRSGMNKRLIEMGVAAGDVVEVARVSPDNGAVDLIVRDYRLPLNPDEAAGIEVAAC